MMSETQRELVRSESPEWQEVFWQAYLEFQKDCPDITFEEAIRHCLTIRAISRELVSNIFM